MIIVQLSKTEGIKPKEKNSREDTVCENLFCYSCIHAFMKNYYRKTNKQKTQNILH